MNITRPSFSLVAQQEQTHAASQNKIDDVSRKLESQFTQMMIKCMRDATPGDPLVPEGNDAYRSMYDRQLSDLLSQGKGLGLASMISRQLGGKDASAQTGDNGTTTGGPIPLSPSPRRAVAFYQRFPAGESSGQALDAIAGRSASNRTTGTGGDVPFVNSEACDEVQDVAQTDPSKFKAGTPEHFVAKIWPEAQRAARELGVDPRALVAQAALETGWGRRGIRGSNGDANNLFGIKATGWSGDRVTTQTHEFVNGQRRSESASFRAYSSPAESFADYVRLLKTSPRYQKALEAGTDVRRFAQGLQNAGYATDPSYARKIYSIAHGPTLTRALASATGSFGSDNLVASR